MDVRNVDVAKPCRDLHLRAGALVRLQVCLPVIRHDKGRSIDASEIGNTGHDDEPALHARTCQETERLCLHHLVVYLRHQHVKKAWN